MGNGAKMEIESAFLHDLVDISPFAHLGKEYYDQYKIAPEGIEIKWKKSRGKWGVSDGTIPEQVPGSISIYNNPVYEILHRIVRKHLEKEYKVRLYPTYYFERIYTNGQRLSPHVDRGACEWSVSLHLSSSIDKSWTWPIYFEHKNGIEKYNSVPGDAVLYNGTEVRHWREPLNCGPDQYYHQLFLHYVNADGKYCQHAFDR